MVTEIRTKDFPLSPNLSINARIGIVKGKKGYILTETDLCHMVVKSIDEKIALFVTDKNEMHSNKSIKLSIKEMLEFAGEEIPLEKWTHYFGIKDRVYRNYKIFQKSCKEISASISFPEWKR